MYENETADERADRLERIEDNKAMAKKRLAVFKEEFKKVKAAIPAVKRPQGKSAPEILGEVSKLETALERSLYELTKYAEAIHDSYALTEDGDVWDYDEEV